MKRENIKRGAAIVSELDVLANRKRQLASEKGPIKVTVNGYGVDAISAATLEVIRVLAISEVERAAAELQAEMEAL